MLVSCVARLRGVLVVLVVLVAASSGCGKGVEQDAARLTDSHGRRPVV